MVLEDCTVLQQEHASTLASLCMSDKVEATTLIKSHIELESYLVT